jgi:RNA polymerase sigma factor (sigma-70 family)
MHHEATRAAVRLIHKLAGNEPRTDAELVAEFTRQGSEHAFAALVRRHGPMVLRLCRRLLGSEPDAEDVFQATFLVLAEKAGSLRKFDAVGPWLFGVASRLARKHRARQQRRRATEQHVGDRPPSEDPLARLSVLESERILHEELASLAPRYRAPLVLCYLEGKTRDEAARELGYCLGTFKDHLERGRRLLHARLTRRGLGLSSALIAGLVAEAQAPAAVTGGLLHATARAFVTPAEVSAPVRALVREGLRALSLWRAAAVGTVLAAVLVGSAFAFRTLAPASSEPPREDPVRQRPAPSTPRPAVDALGDPLPPGAIRRLGTTRYRLPSSRFWLSLPDGRSYLTSGIRRVDADSGRVVETWPVPSTWGQHIAGFSPDGRRVLLANRFIFYTGARVRGQKEEQTWALTLYDLHERKPVWTRQEKLEQKDWKNVDWACFSADGKWILTGGQPDTLRLWDGTTGKELWHRVGEALDPLGFTDGGAAIVLRGKGDAAVYVLDRATGAQRKSFRTIARDEARGFTLAPDGTCVLVGTSGPTVRVWDLATGRERPPLGGHKHGATSVVFAPDGKTLVTGDGDRCVLLRAWPSGKVIRAIDTGGRGIERMAITGDGRRLQVLFWGQQALHRFDLATGAEIPLPLDCHESGVYGVAATPDGMLLSFARDETVRVWDPATGKAVSRLAPQFDPSAGGVAVSGDGRLLAVPASSTPSVRVYERATGKLLTQLPVPDGVLQHLVFSPDGRWLGAAEGGGGRVHAWDVKTGRTVLQTRYATAYGSIACTFSPDSRVFAVADHGTVRFWDVATWTEQPGLGAFANFGLAFSPDGRTLAAASVEGVRLYELASRRLRVYLPPKDYPTGVLHFSPDGRWLAWVGNQGMIHLWDVHRGALVVLSGHDAAVTDLAFTADGRTVVSASDDTTLLVWDLARAAAMNPPPKPGDVEQAWRALAGDDAKAAYEAIRALAVSPDAAVRRMAQELKPAAPADVKHIQACLRDLDDADFAVRERATGDLERMGDQTAAALERFLAGKPSLEARRRAEHLLVKARGTILDPERLREVRALEALERVGTDDARRLLETLSKGAPDAGRTRDARRALERLRR